MRPGTIPRTERALQLLFARGLGPLALCGHVRRCRGRWLDDDWEQRPAQWLDLQLRHPVHGEQRFGDAVPLVAPGAGVRSPLKAIWPLLFITSWKTWRKLPPPGAESPACTMVWICPLAPFLTYKPPRALMKSACGGKPATTLPRHSCTCPRT